MPSDAMSLWVKICGNTSLEDAKLAVEARADALGFVFASSPRQVSLAQVAAITSKLPGSIEKIGVFVDSTLEEIEAAIRGGGLTGVQIHSDAAADLPSRLRASFGPGLRILRVVHFREGFAEETGALAGDSNIDALLLDSRTATAVGGTGIAFDWQSASADLSGAAVPRFRLVVAGGLSPQNVAEAVATLHPWGVDVVSGVEAAPGRKDAEKIRAFVANARSAAARTMG
jgi:phosphoribosylanthranilate isomerase